jgi:23S rRNA (uracil1939-C5)-methyltransferase
MELTPIDMAHGGSAVARIDGKVFFVDGAIPGELVAGEIELDKGSWGRIRLDEVLEPSLQRVAPRCRHFDTCGGCQWQFASYGAQLEWKRSTIAGQLAHLGGLHDPEVRETIAPGSPFNYRNRMDFKVAAGRPALHRRKSKELVPLIACELLHPNLADLFPDLGSLDGVKTLTLRTSVATGDVLAIVDGEVPLQAAAWDCHVAQISSGKLHPVRGATTIEEQVAGTTFRITGDTFFQNNTAGAEALVRLVTQAVDLNENDTLLDAYAGGGLFAATVGRESGRVIGIEANPITARDLQSNLNRAEIDDFRVICGATEEVIERVDEYWDVVIADPPRRGLGIEGVGALTAATPRTLVYISCDVASLARDSRLLDEVGYRLDWVTPVDMFPQTYHVESVARYTRAD